MVISFPASPTLNEVYIFNGIQYIWDGAKWISGGATTYDALYLSKVNDDNANGTITLGTDKITLNAADGSATFTGGDVAIGKHGSGNNKYVYVYSPDAASGTAAFGVYDTVGSKDLARINNNGSASFANSVNVGSSTSRLGNGSWGYQVYGTKNENGFALYQSTTHDIPSAPYFLRCNVTGVGDTVTVKTDGEATFAGAVSKGSGSFRIDHPLKPETHQLVHSFVEGPQADNIYRGKVDLVDGIASVNVDTVSGMTEGTFAALNREIQCFTTNETGWTAIKGSVSGNILTIEAQDPACTDTISWLVIGERQDQHMYDTTWTDENGKVIVEPEKVLDDVEP